MRLLALSIVMSFIAFSIFSISGCVTVPGGLSKVEKLQPAETLKFDDVSVPVGFKILPEESFILESAGLRSGVLKYTGRADVENVVRFYKNQMPIHNWALLNVLEYGERILSYERENESCVIVVKPRSGSRIDISVSLAPKSPIPASNREAVTEESVTVEPIK